MAANFLVIANPDSRRVALFQAALAGQGLPPARIVAYADLLAGRVSLAEAVRPGAIVRIESPGKDFEVERALIAAGADIPDEEGYDRVSRAGAERLTFDHGRILFSRQWFLGFRAALDQIEEQLAHAPPHRLMLRPGDIKLMFDKRACHARLEQREIAVPPSLGPICCYDQLIVAMRQARCSRVFIKLAHGSSASGVVAYQVGAARHHATTTVELERHNGALRLYNSRRLRVYQDQHEIAALIDALCRHRVHVEQWLPKAGVDERTFDLRVVVIAGQVRHVVVRLSRGPMTNLHLLNARGDLGHVLARMGSRAWDAARRTCEQVLGCFGGSLYAGIDLLICPGYRRHAVLEVNAFGDLLPGVLCDGMDTYTAEILAQQRDLCFPEPPRHQERQD